MKFEDFTKIIIGVAGNFGASIEPATLDIWFDLAKEDGLTTEQLKSAAAKILRSRKNTYGRMPTYADFLTTIRGDPENDANVQIAYIRSALKTNSSTEPPEFTDPITRVLMISRWTWGELCMLPIDKLPFWERDFREAYLSISADPDRAKLQIEEGAPLVKETGEPPGGTQKAIK